MARYVPRTYNNRRFIRVVITASLSVALAFVLIFIILFFSLRPYFVTYEDGTQKLEIPWLMEDSAEP